MVSYLQVKTGIEKFIDQELLAKITGWQKWFIGAGLQMYLEDGLNIFNNIKSNPIIQQIDIIDEEDHIDIDKLYKFIIEQARKNPVTFKAPLVGDITLTSDDVDKLYHYIKN